MTSTIADRALGDLVTERPQAARIFDRVGLDYCCRGDDSLADAAAAAGLDVEQLAGQIADLDVQPDDAWQQLTPPELAADIVATHHACLREELPLLDALAQKVERVHGHRHSELAAVRHLVQELRDDLVPHLDKEERVLFPAIAALYAGVTEFPFGSVRVPIRVMTAEHDNAGDLLESLRQATTGYVVPEDGCASYRSLYERLEALEHDTHVHIHKENHRLFPAAIAEEVRR